MVFFGNHELRKKHSIGSLSPFLYYSINGRPWHTSPQTDTPLGLLRGMPRYSRISIIRVNTNATVCGYTVVFRLSISLANTIAFTSTLTSIYLPLFSYYLLKQQKYSYKSISCHCVSTERYAMFALDMPRSFCNK